MTVPKLDFDIVVIGSGFSGSICALVLRQVGYRVAVVDKATHPRFAIGESSTPIADSYLRSLAEEFNLPELNSLSTFEGICKTYPQIRAGRKRGFSYFWHHADKVFSAGKNHQNELLAAATATDETADSHWMRSDVDHFLVGLFKRYDIEFYSPAAIQNISPTQNGWQIVAESIGESKPIVLSTKWFVDASGRAAVGAKAAGAVCDAEQLQTRTAACFAHFDGLRRWSDHGLGGASNDHPFSSDDAAVHHLFSESDERGWMWQLRFATGRVSCGICLDLNFGESESLLALGQNAPDEFFQQRIDRYPSLKSQFENGRIVMPGDHAQMLTPVQYLQSMGGGANWIALPNTVGFVDALHSKGIAHALSGIYRLGKCFRAYSQNEAELPLAALGDQFRAEVIWIDQIVSLAYQSLGSFETFRLALLWYFAAVTTFEREKKLRGGDLPFLLCGDERFADALVNYRAELDQVISSGNGDIRRLELSLQEKLAPYDHVGLFSPPIHNMYGSTASPEK